MTRTEALTAAAALDREAADLAAQSRAKLEEARKVRAPHCGLLERELLAASAEVACWHPGKRAEFRAHYEREAAGRDGGEEKVNG